ncbi:MAG: hypothetical protein JWO59_695 [Chloroflexi bacterium]|nr:hypothetical protein [Chloroflexota bacterium]
MSKDLVLERVAMLKRLEDVSSWCHDPEVAPVLDDLDILLKAFSALVAERDYQMESAREVASRAAIVTDTTEPAVMSSIHKPCQDDVLLAHVQDHEDDLSGSVELEPHYILTCGNCGRIVEVELYPGGGDGYDTRQAYKDGWRNVDARYGWQVRCPPCLNALQLAKDVALRPAGPS